MIIRFLLAAVLALGLSTSPALAQTGKIGYADIEIILGNMPATRQMSQQLQTYQAKLSERIQQRQNNARTKLQQYQELLQSGASEDDARVTALEEELTALDQEIQAEVADAEEKLAQKRADLLEPIQEQLQGVIEEVASELGYDYILNARDGSGTSIVLYGPEDRNLTLAVLKKMGINPQQSGN